MNKFVNLNKNTRLFKVEVENPVFKRLNEFKENEVLKVLGMYINNKSTFGDEPIFIVEDIEDNIFFVNMPKHHLDTLNTIINDSELVQGINERECFIKTISYYSKRFKKQCYDFEFVSMEDFKSFIEEWQKQKAIENDNTQVF